MKRGLAALCCQPSKLEAISHSEDNRAVSRATGGCDGRQEGRERGYYHLHRYLNESFLSHNSPPS